MRERYELWSRVTVGVTPGCPEGAPRSEGFAPATLGTLANRSPSVVQHTRRESDQGSNWGSLLISFPAIAGGLISSGLLLSAAAFVLMETIRHVGIAGSELAGMLHIPRNSCTACSPERRRETL